MTSNLVETSDVIQAIMVLTSPETAAEEAGWESWRSQLFDGLLKEKLHHLQGHLQSSDKCKMLKAMLDLENPVADTADHRWQFVQWNLKLLSVLQKLLAESMQQYSEQRERVRSKNRHVPDAVPPMAPDTLTFPQQKALSASLQFIVGLGMCPNLLPGVGLPLGYRSEFGQLLQVTELGPDLSRTERDSHLWECTECLLNCLNGSPSLGTAILSRHLGDLLAALLQLSYAPPLTPIATEPAAGLEIRGVGPHDGNLSQATPASIVDHVLRAGNQVSPGQKSIREESRKHLSTLIERVYQPLLVRELLILQGGPPPKAMQQKYSRSPALTRSPSWLRKICGRILSDRLMKPDGVQHVLRGMLDCTGGIAGMKEANASVDWRKCNAVAKVIASCPRQVISVQDYYMAVCPQVLDLIRVKDKLLSQQFLRVAASTLSEMHRQSPQVAWNCGVKPLLGPLAGGEGSVVIKDTDLSQTVEDIHKMPVMTLQVFAVGLEPQSPLVQSLEPLLHLFFKLFCFLQQGVTHDRTLIKDILLVFLKQQDQVAILDSLQLLAFGQTSDKTSLMVSTAEFSISEMGSHIVIDWSAGQGAGGDDWEMTSQCLVQLLQEVKKDEVTAEFFLAILKELTSIISSADDKLLPAAAGHGAGVRHSLIVVGLLSLMCEQLEHGCLLHNTTHILEFVQATLERGVKVGGNATVAAPSWFDSETLLMAMGLLTAVTGGTTTKMTEADWTKSRDLIPLLRHLSDSPSVPEVQRMAADLQVAVATHGKVWTSTAPDAKTPVEAKSQEKPNDKREGQVTSRPLVEVLHSEEAMEGTEYADVIGKATGRGKTGNAATSLEEALGEVSDPLVPVRGHGLIRLRKLIDSRDADTLDKREEVIRILRDNLNHVDSYIYLNAVQALASLGEKFPAKVLPVLLEDYSDINSIGHIGKVIRSSELRMKLGEVLIKVCRALGDMVPQYREPLLNAMLSGARDQDPLVRASSLSNLGELCKLLHYSLGGILHEVMSCVSSLVKSDPEVEVRRSAAMFTTLLLRGLGLDAIKVLEDVLRDLYRLLKHVITVDRDEVVQLHTQLALEELDEIMTRHLFPKQTLEKRIRVLDP